MRTLNQRHVMDSRIEPESRQDKEELQRMKLSAQWLRKNFVEDMKVELHNER